MEEELAEVVRQAVLAGPHLKLLLRDAAVSISVVYREDVGCYVGWVQVLHCPDILTKQEMTKLCKSVGNCFNTNPVDL